MLSSLRIQGSVSEPARRFARRTWVPQLPAASEGPRTRVFCALNSSRPPSFVHRTQGFPYSSALVVSADVINQPAPALARACGASIRRSIDWRQALHALPRVGGPGVPEWRQKGAGRLSGRQATRRPHSRAGRIDVNAGTTARRMREWLSMQQWSICDGSQPTTSESGSTA